MTYTTNDIDKILGFTTWDGTRKVDELLRIDASIYANQGSDSTKSERDQARRESKTIYKAIKEVDPELGTSFLNLMDNV